MMGKRLSVCVLVTFWALRDGEHAPAFDVEALRDGALDNPAGTRGRVGLAREGGNDAFDETEMDRDEARVADAAGDVLEIRVGAGKFAADLVHDGVGAGLEGDGVEFHAG